MDIVDKSVQTGTGVSDIIAKAHSFKQCHEISFKEANVFHGVLILWHPASVQNISV
jgi:hypothetical protein